MSGALVDQLVTSGTFSLDDGVRQVENNVWVVGDDREAIVIDAAHDADAVLALLAGRELRAIVCTHAHSDHVAAAPALAAATGAPVLLHPDDMPLWKLTHPEVRPDGALSDGQRLSVAGVDLTVLHTPGHAPGAVCLHAPELGTVFTGDTLFHGGPGATGRSFSSFPVIVESIRTRLLTLPPETVVRTGHGENTTVGAEAPQLEEWIRRGF
ncbi:MBL fold metallo-hydrolase [Streptomyces sp. AS58]|uniref:MBL fold metallo-hydrolase n=1 Tax=Streptomyces sp. AS58 TaxID=1519489 RepID=UPI0006AFC930|nr:MBL fold metallo-hydrolase [Streptomyces sp. AS58]